MFLYMYWKLCVVCNNCIPHTVHATKHIVLYLVIKVHYGFFQKHYIYQTAPRMEWDETIGMLLKYGSRTAINIL